MTRTIVLIIAFAQIYSYANCKQYLYVETRLGGCYEPLPIAYYVEVPDLINPNKILENDSVLVGFLNKSDKIYASCEMLYILRDTAITENIENKFIKDYEDYRKAYSFVRNENWDHFQIKIAVVEHEMIEHSPLNLAHPKNAELYEYQNGEIHITISEKRNFNYAYKFE